MERKKKTSLIVLILVLLLILALVAVLIWAFTKKEPTSQHEHSYSLEWSRDENYHWHASICGHDNEVSGKTNHSWNDGVITKDATEDETGTIVYTCSVCNWTKTETIDKVQHKHTYQESWKSDETYHWHASTCGHESEVSGKAKHTWNEGVISKPATENEMGIKTYTCTVCARTRDEILSDMSHQHSFSKEWSYDGMYHWHAATCGHESLKSDEELHSWKDIGIIIVATDTVEGEIEQKCLACAQTRIVNIGYLNHKHEFEKSWTYDDQYHWHATTCGHTGFISEVTRHDWGDGDIVSLPTVYDEGVIIYACLTCAAEKEEYTPELNSFTVIFLDKDYNTVSQRNYELGTQASNVYIPSTVDLDGYHFVGWLEITSLVQVDDFNFSSAKNKDVYYFKATYEKIYRITFNDYLGNELTTIVVTEEHNSLTLKDCPTIPEREGYTSYWDVELLKDITGDLVMIPIYEQILFEVVFKDRDGNLLFYVDESGQVITKQSVPYGSFAIVPDYERYYLDKTEMKLYEFSGWSAPFDEVKENLVIVAQYDVPYNEPVIAAKLDGGMLSITLILPSNNVVIYSLSLSFTWEVDKGTCDIASATLRSTTPLDPNYGQKHTCTVGEKDKWLNYNNKTRTFDFVWNCGEGHAPNNTHFINNIFTLTYDVYDGATFNATIFEMLNNSVVIYGDAGGDIANVYKSQPIIWFYE